MLLLLACETPPPAVEVELTPDEASTTDDLVSVVSDQGLTLEFRWSVDEVRVDDLVTEVVPAERTAKGELWRVEARSVEGEERGPWASDEVHIANSAPQLVSLAIEPAEPTSEDDLSAVVEVSEADADEVTLELSWQLEGVEQGTAEVLSAAMTERGQVWTLQARAGDGAETVEDHVELSIGNGLPSAAVTLSPEAPTTSSTLTATVTVGDPDGDPVSTSLAWFVDGTELAEYADATELPASATSRDQAVRVEVVPNDGFTDGEVASAEVVVLNEAPSATAAVVDPGEVYEGSTLSCLAEGFSDADGDPEGDHEVRWWVDEAEVSATTLDGSHFDKGDSLRCGLRPSDGTDLGEELLSEAVDVLNSPPDVSAASLTISPTDPVEADVVTYTLSGVVDDDGDSWTEHPRWLVDGTPVGASSSLDGSDFDKGDTLVLELHVEDSEASDTLASNTLTVANTAPTISAAAVSSPLYTDSTATVSVSSSDPDPGDTVTMTYSWSVDGAAAGSRATLDGETWFDRGEVVSVDLTPSDGTDSGATFTATSATVQNTPPTAPEVSIVPAEPEVEEELICAIDADSDDADGDSVTYTFAWEVDGSSFSGAGTTDETGDTVPEGQTGGSEEWTCTVTPTDSWGDDGDEAEDTVTTESCWEEVYSASLASAPSGIVTANGSWGGHSYSSKDGVGCLYQSSDWNVAYVPVTRGSKDFERIEIDVWWPGSSSDRSFDVYAFGERYGTSDVYDALWFGTDTSNSWMTGGDTYSSSTTIASWSKNIISTSQWVSLAFVVDHGALTVDLDVDDTAKANALVISDAAWVDGTHVVLSSDGKASSVSADTCWAELRIYESDEETDCFD